MKAKMFSVLAVSAIVAGAAHGKSATVVIDGVKWNYTQRYDGVAGWKIGSDGSTPQALANAPEGAVTIPSKINGTAVTAIGTSAFQGYDKMTSVVIPSTVTAIGQQAFKGCTSLKSIAIPQGVTSIPYQCFEGCTALATVSGIDSSKLESVSQCAFRYCASLQSIAFPATLKSLSTEVFSGCTSLQSVTIPSSSTVNAIMMNAFLNCTSLKSFTFPAGVTQIGNNAFEGCRSLTSIQLPSPSMMLMLGASAFSGCSSLTSVTWPTSTSFTSIPASFFKGCGFTTITIPKSVTSIGKDAFADCQKLTEFKVESGNTKFKAINKLLCSSDDWGNKYIVGVPNGATSLAVPADDYVFASGSDVVSGLSGCHKVTSITVASGSRYTVSNGMLSDSDKLLFCAGGVSERTIPARFTTLDVAAFASCTGLRVLNFEGDKPEIKDSTTLLASTPRDLKVYADGGKTGWPAGGSDSWPVSGENGRRLIVISGSPAKDLESSDHVTVRAGTSLDGVTLSSDKEVTVLPKAGVTVNADELCGQVKVTPTAADQDASYFKAKAVTGANGEIVIGVGLNEEVVDVAGTMNAAVKLEDFQSMAGGEKTSVTFTSVKPGLYYSFGAAASVEGLSDAMSARQKATSGSSLTFDLVKPTGDSAFMQLKVSDSE